MEQLQEGILWSCASLKAEGALFDTKGIYIVSDHQALKVH